MQGKLLQLTQCQSTTFMMSSKGTADKEALKLELLFLWFNSPIFNNLYYLISIRAITYLSFINC